MKKLAKYICPPIFWEFAKKGRSLVRRGKKKIKQSRYDALESAFLASNAQASPNSIVVRPNLELKIHPDSRGSFEYFCYKAPVMVEEMDFFLRETDDKLRLLDIGALHGIFSLVFAAKAPDRRVLAIDASPIAFSRLLYNIHTNQFKNIKPIECAVTTGAGKLKMHYEWEHAIAAGTRDCEQAIEVNANSADNICEENEFSPDAIKIDVEGHEVKVLKGLVRTISECRPIIFLEVHPRQILQEGDSLAEIESIFFELGYSATQPDGRPFQLSSLTEASADERVILRPKAEQVSGGKG